MRTILKSVASLAIVLALAMVFTTATATPAQAGGTFIFAIVVQQQEISRCGCFLNFQFQSVRIGSNSVVERLPLPLAPARTLVARPEFA